MRHVISFAFLATVMVLASVQAMPGLNKECWEDRPTVTFSDCCKGFNLLPETALEECNSLYPEDVEETTTLKNNKKAEKDTGDDEDDADAEDDEDDEEMTKPTRRPHHHHHHGHHRHGRHHCVMECYFNMTGIFKDRQVVKETALKLFNDNTQSSGAFKASLSSGIETCVAEMNAIEEKFQEMFSKNDHPRPRPPHHHGGKHCHPKASHFTKCVELNAFKNCPADRRVSNTECSKLAEFMEKCAPPKFPGFPGFAGSKA